MENEGHIEGTDDDKETPGDVEMKQTAVAKGRRRTEETDDQDETLKLVQETARLGSLLKEERMRSEDYLNRLKYLQADFENYRKRIDREIQGIEDFSTTRLIRSFLPIIDALDIAVASNEGSGKDNPLLEGVRMVYKNLVSVLETEGLKRIDAVGRSFDPELHEAVERVKGRASRGGDIVVEEIRGGFTFKGKILRASMVKVALGSNGKNEEEEGEA